MTGLINEVIVMANSTSASTAAPVRGRRTRDMADKQARIFEAARRLFAERRYAAVTTQQVSAEADIATGTLFRYAATKAELLLMVYNEEFRAVIAGGESAARAADSVLDAVWALARPLLEFAGENRETSAIYQRELLFGARGERFREDGLALVSRWQRAVAEHFAAGDPGRGDDGPAELAARSAFAVVSLWISEVGDEHRPLSTVRSQLAQIAAGVAAEPAES